MLALFFAVAVLQAAEPAPAPAAEAPLITNPVWISRPTPEDMVKTLPGLAQDKKVGGRVIINCTVTKAGFFADCTVESEDPAEFGFGKAALKLSKRFRIKPQTADGQSVEGGKVRIPIVWTVTK